MPFSISRFPFSLEPQSQNHPLTLRYATCFSWICFGASTVYRKGISAEPALYESRKQFALRNCSREKRVYPAIGCFWRKFWQWNIHIHPSSFPYFKFNFLRPVNYAFDCLDWTTGRWCTPNMSVVYPCSGYMCCFVLLNRYWGIVTVPGSFLKAGDLGWPDPHPSP